MIAEFHGFIGSRIMQKKNHAVDFFKISVQSVSNIMKIEHSEFKIVVPINA